MNNKLIADLIVLWVVAVVFALIALVAWVCSIHDDGVEDKIGCAFGPLILVAAVVITILQVAGVIGVW